ASSICEAIAAVARRSARLQWKLDSGCGVGESSTQVDGLPKGISRAERQAVRQSLFDAGLSGVVVADAVALHHIDGAVALIGTTKIDRGYCGWNAWNDYRTVVDCLGQ